MAKLLRIQPLSLGNPYCFYVSMKSHINPWKWVGLSSRQFYQPRAPLCTNGAHPHEPSKASVCNSSSQNSWCAKTARIEMRSLMRPVLGKYLGISLGVILIHPFLMGFSLWTILLGYPQELKGGYEGKDGMGRNPEHLGQPNIPRCFEPLISQQRNSTSKSEHELSQPLIARQVWNRIILSQIVQSTRRRFATATAS